MSPYLVLAGFLIGLFYSNLYITPYMMPDRLKELSSLSSINEPIVIRNGFPVQNMTHIFAHTYKDTIVNTLIPEQKHQRGGHGHVIEKIKLKDLLLNKTYKGFSMHSYQQFFNQSQYSEVFGDRFLVLQNIPDAIYLGSQLFLANNLKSGTPFHFAWGTNIFVQLNGRKRWVLINPKYAQTMGCEYGPGGLYATCPKFENKFSQNTIEDQLNRKPDKIPYFDFVLNPGDILVNPPLWLHAIENMEVPSIALSIRYLNFQQARHAMYQSLDSYMFHFYNSLKYSFFKRPDQDSFLNLGIVETILKKNFRKFDIDAIYADSGILNNNGEDCIQIEL